VAGCVLLADRHHDLAEGVRDLLETTFARVYIVANEASLVEGAQRLQPVVIIADLSLVETDLTGFVGRVLAAAPEAKLLLLSVHGLRTLVVSTLGAGAHGIVLKRAIAADLLPAVDAVLAGRRYVSPALSHQG